MTTNSENIQASLSIRIAADGLSFASYAPNQPQPYAYTQYKINHTISMAANLKIALQTEPMLKRDYKRVNILVSSPQFTMMPIAEFQADKAADYYNFVFPAASSSSLLHISYNILRRSGIVILFALDRNVYHMLIDEYPRARFYAAASTLTEFFSEKSHLDNRASIFAYISRNILSLYCFCYGNLSFANTYHVKSASDCQYYILALWKELGLNQLDDSLEIISDNNDDYALSLSGSIVNFISHTRLLERSEDFKDTITKGNNIMPYDLQTLLVCGY